VLELLIFAALAGVVLVQLYRVLGTRVGRQPEEAGKSSLRRPDAATPLTKPTEADAGLAAVRSRDAAFDPAIFLAGAREAYVRTVRAFAAGDRETLRGLTSPVVYASFEAAVAAREVAGRTEAVEFLLPPRADLEESGVAGDVLRAKVRFLAEVRTRSKDAAGEAVDDRRTAELWSFERRAGSRDPNWTLTRVEAAQD